MGLSVTAEVPQIALTKYAAFAHSQVLGATVTAPAAGLVSASFAAGGKWLTAAHVLTIHGDVGDYLYVDILDSAGGVVASPIPSTNPVYFFIDYTVDFLRTTMVPAGGSVRVRAYVSRAKTLSVEVELGWV